MLPAFRIVSCILHMFVYFAAAGRQYWQRESARAAALFAGMLLAEMGCFLAVCSYVYSTTAHEARRALSLEKMRR